MQEIGIDISGKKPENIKQYLSQPLDFVVTVCDDAREKCPAFHENIGRKVHYRFIDPVTSEYPEHNRIELFRVVRDEIKLKIKEFYTDYINNEI